jgi:hypothetical protein
MLHKVASLITREATPHPPGGTGGSRSLSCPQPRLTSHCPRTQTEPEGSGFENPWDMRSSFSFDVTQRMLVDIYRRFGTNSRSHFQGSSMWVSKYQYTQRNIPEEWGPIYIAAAAAWNPPDIFMCNSHVTVFRFSVSRSTKTHAVATASVFLLLTPDWFALWIIHKPRIIYIQTSLHYTVQREPRNTKNTFPEAAGQQCMQWEQRFCYIIPTD